MEHLSLADFRPSVVTQALLQVWPLIILLPFALAGAIVHYPAYKLCGVFAERYSRHDADDISSTVKVLAGMVLVPMTWFVTTVAADYFLGWKSAVLSLPLVVICGYAALYTLEETAELRGWAKAVLLFFTRRDVFLRLYVERRDLMQGLARFRLMSLQAIRAAFELI